MPAPDGVLNVLKPVGMTSHDVVDAVRRAAGTRRVGHTGTLDPGAAGVLVLAVGRATRLAEFIAESDKAYRVEVVFGRATDTGDAYGATLAEHSAAGLTGEQVASALERFVGEIEQVPPMASAVRYAGRRLYELRREGQTVEVPPRRVRVYQFELLEFWLRDGEARARLDVRCSKGTYIRGLCHELGAALGVGAHAAFMVRTRVGCYTLEDAHTLEEVATAGAAPLLRPPDEALAELPAVALTAPQRQAVLHGQGVPLFKVPGWQQLIQARVVQLRDEHGLVALARVEQGVLRPFKVLREG
ncbi:MAG TPA: tRNA pseudouridine(55) synthase TruB [bacterium]|nr:tRNA pseudouridine(55) synthase TruB [bacterium]